MYKPLENKKSQKLSYGNCDFFRSFICFTPHSKSTPRAVLSFLGWLPLTAQQKFVACCCSEHLLPLVSLLCVEHVSLCFRCIIDNISTSDNNASKSSCSISGVSSRILTAEVTRFRICGEWSGNKKIYFNYLPFVLSKLSFHQSSILIHLSAWMEKGAT
jgi:hypothetical protein